MKILEAERKQIENEMIFRRMNEKVGVDLDELNAMHVKDGNHDLVSEDDFLLLFKCECSNEDCDERIPLKLSDYRKIHTDRNTFIVIPNHQIDAIEKVIQEKDRYNVVVKNNSTPEPSDILNNTKSTNT